jgi:hypothetical protein
MKRRFLSLFFAVLMTLSLCGCGGTAGEIAGSVADAAMKELKNQVTQLLEKNKLEVVEIKTAFGKLNDDGGKYQLFLAALVKTQSESVAQSAADALNKLFTDAGACVQTGSAVENSHLVHKNITFKHSDFSQDGYYLIWGYVSDLSIDLPNLVTIPETTE